MGYYSEVALCMKKSDYLLGVEWLRSLNIKNQLNILLPENCSNITETIDGIVVAHYSYVKWNKMFEDLVPLYSFFKFIGDDRYYLVELGEDGAIFEEGDPCEFAHVVWPISQLHFEFGLSDKQIDSEDIEKNDIYYIISYKQK